MEKGSLRFVLRFLRRGVWFGNGSGHGPLAGVGVGSGGGKRGRAGNSQDECDSTARNEHSFAHESAGQGEIAIPVAAPVQPGGLVRLGRGGIRESAARAQAAFSEHWLFDLPLVPCHGTGVLRRRKSRAIPQSTFRQHQSRSRRASGRGQDLHDGGASNGRRWWLAVEYFSNARFETVLRWHLLSADS